MPARFHPPLMLATLRHANMKLSVMATTMVLLVSAAASAAGAVSGHDLAWFTIDGGGGDSSSTAFALGGTIGQPDAMVMTGAGYELVGGFWAGIVKPTLACPGDMVSSATFQPPPDGIVDGADLAFLLGEWGPTTGIGSPADIVSNATFMPPPDGVVDGADLAVLLGAWGGCE